MDRTKKIVYGDDVYEFDEEKHVHVLNGHRLNGVTTLIDKTLAKPALIQWSADMTAEQFGFLNPKKNGKAAVELALAQAQTRIMSMSPKEYEAHVQASRVAHTKKKTDAGDWGTRVHNACEEWGKNGTMTADEDILPSVQNFADFITNNGFKILDIERSVWSKEWWIGGIFDLVLEKNGKVYIADIKTSSGIYDSHLIQMGAYYKCLLENGWVKDYGVDAFDGAIVINLKKDHTISHCTSPALDAMMDTYAGIVKINGHKEALELSAKNVRYGKNY